MDGGGGGVRARMHHHSGPAAVRYAVSSLGFLMTLTRAGVEVPRDLSVVGYDDSHLSHLMPIGLTTVRQDAVLTAEYAVRFAVERLESTAPEPREAVLDPKLTVRGTSGPPPAA